MILSTSPAPIRYRLSSIVTEVTGAGALEGWRPFAGVCAFAVTINVAIMSTAPAYRAGALRASNIMYSNLLIITNHLQLFCYASGHIVSTSPGVFLSRSLFFRKAKLHPCMYLYGICP